MALKIVVNYHGEDLMYEEKGYTKILGEVTQRFCRHYRFGDSLLDISRISWLAGIFFHMRLKVIVSPSGGINPALFFPLETKSYDSALYQDMSVGRIDKGIREFLQTCDRLKQNGVVFKASVNSGIVVIYDEVMRCIDVHDLKKEITIVNGVHKNRLGDYYRGMDLLIFSSSRTGESLGLTVLRPWRVVYLLGSDIGGIASYGE